MALQRVIKFIVIFLIFPVFYLNASTFYNGWNLISFSGETTFLNSLKKDSNITIVWTYDKGKWSAYSPKNNITKLIIDKNISIIKKITPSQGVWVLVKGEYKPNFTTNFLYTNEINITRGWNLKGLIENESSIYEIDPKGIFWKYKDGDWFLGDNKKSNNWINFEKIYNGEGFWVYSDLNFTYNENRYKKILFLDEDMLPIKDIKVKNKYSKIDGIVDILPFTSSLDIKDKRFKKIKSRKLNFDEDVDVVFLEDASLKVIGDDENITKLIVTDFTLPNYFKAFYPIVSYPVEAAVVPPLISGGDVFILFANKNINQSITMFIDKLDTTPQSLNIGKFIKGFKLSAKDVNANPIPNDNLDYKAYIKPIFSYPNKLQHPFVYAKKDQNWEFVAPAIKRGNKYISKKWYDRFTTFILVDLNESNFSSIQGQVFDKMGRVLRDVIIVSDNKIFTSTDINGTFEFNSPTKPKKLIAYKQGYVPKKLDLNNTKKIVLKKLLTPNDIEGLHIKLDKNFKPIYTIGTKKAHFKYLSDDYSIRPKLLLESNKTIYASVYPYKDGYVFASSDSSINWLKNSGEIEKIREGDGLIFDGFVVKDDTIYYGTFGDTFGVIDDSGLEIDDALSGYEFFDYPLSVVYKPIITDTKIYIPLYNSETNATNVTLFIKGKEDSSTNNLDLISGYGEAGKLSQTNDYIIFGTSKSKILFVDKKNNKVVKNIDFNGSGIIANVIFTQNHIYAIDLNGRLKKFDINGSEIKSLDLKPSSNLLLKNNKIIVATHNGEIFQIDKDLNILSSYKVDDNIYASPIIYDNNIYTITYNGKLYKNDKLIGSFTEKIFSVNLVKDTIIIATENGNIWKLSIL